MAPQISKKRRAVECPEKVVIDLLSSDDESSIIQRPQKVARHASFSSQATSGRQTAERHASQRDRGAQSSSQAEELDADSEVFTSQDFDDNAYQALMLYGHVQTKIVGIQYYRGCATMGECIVIRREPTNPVHLLDAEYVEDELIDASMIQMLFDVTT